MEARPRYSKERELLDRTDTKMERTDKLADSASEGLILDNGHLRLEFDNASYANAGSWYLTYGYSYDYDIEIGKDFPHIANEYALSTSAQDGTESYGIDSITYFDYVNYTNAQAYRIEAQRSTSQYDAKWIVTVILPDEKSYCLVEVNITNTDNEQIILDETGSHVHDGIIHLGHLDARIGTGTWPDTSCSDDHVYVNGHGEASYAGTTGWHSYSANETRPFASIYDGPTNQSVTTGFLESSTAPNQFITFYRMASGDDVEAHIDATIGQANPDPGETITCTSFIGFHDRDVESGDAIYDQVQSDYDQYQEGGATTGLECIEDMYGNIWIENSYYRILLDNFSVVQVKTGSSVREWNIYDGVLKLLVAVSDTGNYAFYAPDERDIWDSKEILTSNGEKATIRYTGKVRILDETDSYFIDEKSFELYFTAYDDSGLVTISISYANSTEWYDQSGTPYTGPVATNWRVMARPGGDQNNDYWYYSGKSSAESLPADGSSYWTIVTESDLATIDGYSFITNYDTNYRQGMAWIALKNETEDSITDMNYGRAGVNVGPYSDYCTMNLRTNASIAATRYLMFYEPDDVTPYQPVVDAINAGLPQETYETPAEDYELQIRSNWTSEFRGFKKKALHDYDGDADAELFLTPTDTFNNTVYIFDYNDGSDAWELIDKLTFTIDHNENVWVAPTDLDGDGVIEYIITTSESGTSKTCYLQVFHRSGSALEAVTNRLSFSDGVYDLDFYDLYGDGVKEIALVTGYYESAVYVYNYTGVSLDYIWGRVYGYGFLGSLKIGELDGDIQPEMIVTRAGTTTAIFDWTGSTFAIKWSTSDIGAQYTSLILDIDGDGENEAVGSKWWGEGSYLYKFDYESSSYSYWESINYIPNIDWISPYYNETAQRQDLLFVRRTGVSFAFWNGSGFEEYMGLEANLSTEERKLGFRGDIDGDSDFEFVICEYTSNTSLSNFLVVDLSGSHDTETYFADISYSPLSPSSSDDVQVYARIQDADGIDQSILSYSVNNGPWSNVTMALDGSSWTGIIPAQMNESVVSFKVYANDTLGNWASSATDDYLVLDIVDLKGPDITSSQAPEAVTPSDIVTITASITDSSGVKQAILSYSVDSGIWTNVSMDHDSPDWTADIPAQESDSNVEYKIYAEDTVGNWAVSSSSFYTVSDTSGPSISNIEYTPSEPDQDDEVTVSASISDDSGVKSVELSYSTGGSWTDVSMTYSSGEYSAEIPTQSAGVTVEFKVVAEDNDGNSAQSSIYSYTVADTEAPIVSISRNPANPTEDDVVTVSAEISDASSILSTTLKYSLNAGSTWTDVAMSEDNGIWTGDIPEQAPDETVTYKVVAEDAAGNEGESDVADYEVEAFNSTTLAEQYLLAGETLVGPRTTTLLSVDYDVFQFKDSSGSTTGYLAIDMSEHMVVEDESTCRLVFIQDYIEENWAKGRIAFWGDSDTASLYSDLADEWQQDAMSFNQVSSVIFGTLWFITGLKIILGDVPIVNIINIVEALVAAEDPAIYFASLGSAAQELRSEYQVVYETSPMFDFLDFLDNTYSYINPVLDAAWAAGFDLLGDFTGATESVADAMQGAGGLLIDVIFSGDIDVMLSDSLVTSWACSMIARLCDCIEHQYTVIADGQADVVVYYSLQAFLLYYIKAIKALASWKISVLNEFKTGGSIFTWFYTNTRGYDFDSEIQEWNAIINDYNTWEDSIIAEWNRIQSYSSNRVDMAMNRISACAAGIETNDKHNAEASYSASISEVFGLIFVLGLASVSISNYKPKKRSRLGTALIVIFVIFIAIFVWSLYSTFFVDIRDLPLDTSSYSSLHSPVTKKPDANESQHISYAGYTTYTSDSGTNVTVGLMNTRSEEDMKWSLAMMGLLLGGQRLSLEENTTDGVWTVVDFSCEEGYIRLAYDSISMMLFHSNSLSDIETLFDELRA